MAKRAGQCVLYYLSFPIYLLTKDLTKKLKFFDGGTTIFDPQRGRPTKIRPPITAYDPIFLLQNLFMLQKWGC